MHSMLRVFTHPSMFFMILVLFTIVMSDSRGMRLSQSFGLYLKKNKKNCSGLGLLAPYAELTTSLELIPAPHIPPPLGG